MAALPLPRRWQEEQDEPTLEPLCRDCGGNLYGDTCARCGLCQRCGELADDCTCEPSAEERFRQLETGQNDLQD